MDAAWAAVSAVSSAASAVIVIAATLYAYLQLREARRARTAQVVLQFQQWHTAEPYKSARHRLFSGQFGNPADLTPDDSALLEDVVDQLEFLAMLVDLNLLDYEIVSAFYRYSPLRVWEHAHPFIAYVREREHAPGYGNYLETLVQRYERSPRAMTAAGGPQDRAGQSVASDS